MADLIRKRLTGKEEGFTLIELLVVIVILGILMAIAVPSYMGFKDRANKTAAMANVRSVVPSAEAYYQDNNSSYAGLTADIVKNGDATATPPIDAIDPSIKAGTVITSTATTYCISYAQGGYTARVDGPGGTIDATKTTLACT